jgi:hypothetical protein
MVEGATPPLSFQARRIWFQPFPPWPASCITPLNISIGRYVDLSHDKIGCHEIIMTSYPVVMMIPGHPMDRMS